MKRGSDYLGESEATSVNASKESERKIIHINTAPNAWEVNKFDRGESITHSLCELIVNSFFEDSQAIVEKSENSLVIQNKSKEGLSESHFRYEKSEKPGSAGTSVGMKIALLILHKYKYTFEAKSKGSQFQLLPDLDDKGRIQLSKSSYSIIDTDSLVTITVCPNLDDNIPKPEEFLVFCNAACERSWGWLVKNNYLKPFELSKSKTIDAAEWTDAAKYVSRSGIFVHGKFAAAARSTIYYAYNLRLVKSTTSTGKTIAPDIPDGWSDLIAPITKELIKTKTTVRDNLCALYFESKSCTELKQSSNLYAICRAFIDGYKLDKCQWDIEIAKQRWSRLAKRQSDDDKTDSSKSDRDDEDIDEEEEEEEEEEEGKYEREDLADKLPLNNASITNKGFKNCIYVMASPDEIVPLTFSDVSIFKLPLPTSETDRKNASKQLKLYTHHDHIQLFSKNPTSNASKIHSTVCAILKYTKFGHVPVQMVLPSTYNKKFCARYDPLEKKIYIAYQENTDIQTSILNIFRNLVRSMPGCRVDEWLLNAFMKSDSLKPNPSNQKPAASFFPFNPPSHLGRLIFVIDEWGTKTGGIASVNKQLVLSFAHRYPTMKIYVYIFKNFALSPDDNEQQGLPNNVILIEPIDSGSPEPFFLEFKEDSKPSFIIGHAHESLMPPFLQAAKLYPWCKTVLFLHTTPLWVDSIDKSTSEAQTKPDIQIKHDNILDTAKAMFLNISVGNTIYSYWTTYGLTDINHKCFLPTFNTIFSEAYASRPKDIGHDHFGIVCFSRVKGVMSSKGLFLIPAIMESLRKQRCNFSFTLIGVEKGSQVQFKEELGLTNTNNFIALEYCTQEAILKKLAGASLCVMLSYAEPFGLVGLEAIAAGVPTLVPNTSGLGEMLKLHARNESDDMLVNVKEFVNDREAMKKIWTDAIVKVQKQLPGARQFTLESIREKLKKIPAMETQIWDIMSESIQ